MHLLVTVSCRMRGEQVRLLAFVAATSVAAVGFVLGTAVLSIFVVFSLKSVFAVIVDAIAFVAELIVAVVAAITSGIMIAFVPNSMMSQNLDSTLIRICSYVMFGV